MKDKQNDGTLSCFFLIFPLPPPLSPCAEWSFETQNSARMINEIISIFEIERCTYHLSMPGNAWSMDLILNKGFLHSPSPFHSLWNVGLIYGPLYPRRGELWKRVVLKMNLKAFIKIMIMFVFVFIPCYSTRSQGHLKKKVKTIIKLIKSRILKQEHWTTAI